MGGKANARTTRYRRYACPPGILGLVAALSERDAGPSRTVVARALIAVLAILLIAWFAALARDHAIATGASARIVSDPGMSAAEWRTAMDDFKRSHLLDPSSDWSLIQAQYELLRDRQAALVRAERVLRDEPDNLSGWWVVLRATRGVDTRRYREAAAAVRRLNPLPAGG
jgi:hypothetical protein